MNRDYLSDFSLKCGSWTCSFLYLCKAIVSYIILPLAFISLINGIGPNLGDFTGTGIDFSAIIMEFGVYLDRYMLYSIPLIVLAIFIGYYPAGNYARIPFKFIAAVYLSIMLLMFTDGGHLQVTIGPESFDSTIVAGVDFTLSVVGIIYILSIIAFVKGFLAFTEFADNRKAYLEGLAKKFNRKDEKKEDKAREREILSYDEADDDVSETAAASEAAEAAESEDAGAEAEASATVNDAVETDAQNAAEAADAQPAVTSVADEAATIEKE